MTTPDPRMRASDADRDRVAEALREHCAVGRITVEELQERLEAVYAAKTYGELAGITADLPEEDLQARPAPPAHRSGAAASPREPAGGLSRRGIAAVWAAWAMASGINFTIWLALALTGELVYPWWIWVAGPWGAVLLISTLLGGRRF
ncbi:DUF1707 domain-containing protein [Thermomonospora sp. CIF 1]|uniref:DUF1707 SHOCT-like domain-containing protein n=1 Tax=Thermomonospora sp. CIF 1 TaxID=1916083 RepID=UPI000A94E7C6|nr:DUF1707 domain-containing protein [Thermomonospora sp. CIF 1]PKK12829.1 MAG: hypothetical protein BUE48_021110 [Thermomonospora sp. CIF 1]